MTTHAFLPTSTSSNYKVYLFEENDNMRLVFDKHDLVQRVLELYNLMQVNIININTGYSVNEAEKELISYVMGGGSNCFTLKHDRGAKAAIPQLESFLNAAKLVNAMKWSLSPASASSVGQSVFDSKWQRNTSSKLEKPYEVSIEGDGFKPIDTSIDEYASVIDEVYKGETLSKKSVSCCVLYNSLYECALVCDISKSLHTIVKEFPEFQIVREYKELSQSKHEILKEYFTKNMYNELDVINKKLTAFENLYDITNTDPNEEQKAKILCYIKTYYNISTQAEKRIKVSTLLEEVEKDLNITNTTNLKYRFASMLAELGLQKKRYSDGMYIYGLESKSMEKVHNSEADIKHYMSTHPKSP